MAALPATQAPDSAADMYASGFRGQVPALVVSSDTNANSEVIILSSIIEIEAELIQAEPRNAADIIKVMLPNQTPWKDVLLISKEMVSDVMDALQRVLLTGVV